ncbi:hypothetical protein THRCLA_06559 [Thraustotheca clavata]|uniref:Protein kinase domain-containing protein n=1 Tax=Thraustotheca clavata TaxID=74557 RepID=A0A1V9ZN01_9STRA|nr:hypothetical protein THRCLA_06559 [Thraustotheca clavata]
MSTFKQEIDTMKRCRSPYIVDIVAASNEESDEQKLVLEYMDCGDLRSYLDAKQNGEKTKMELTSLEVAWVVANALLDFHDNDIVLGNLSTENILLSTTHYIKVMIPRSAHLIPIDMDKDTTTSRYCHQATDIYLFGNLLQELGLFENSHQYFTISIVKRIMQMIVHRGYQTRLKKLTADCSSKNPNDRPSTQTLVNILQALVKAHHFGEKDRNTCKIHIPLWFIILTILILMYAMQNQYIQ